MAELHAVAKYAIHQARVTCAGTGLSVLVTVFYSVAKHAIIRTGGTCGYALAGVLVAGLYSVTKQAVVDAWRVGMGTDLGICIAPLYSVAKRAVVRARTTLVLRASAPATTVMAVAVVAVVAELAIIGRPESHCCVRIALEARVFAVFFSPGHTGTSYYTTGATKRGLVPKQFRPIMRCQYGALCKARRDRNAREFLLGLARFGELELTAVLHGGYQSLRQIRTFDSKDSGLPDQGLVRGYGEYQRLLVLYAVDAKGAIPLLADTNGCVVGYLALAESVAIYICAGPLFLGLATEFVEAYYQRLTLGTLRVSTDYLAFAVAHTTATGRGCPKGRIGTVCCTATVRRFHGYPLSSHRALLITLSPFLDGRL